MPDKFQKMGKLVDVKQFGDSAETLNRINPVYINEVAGGVYYIPWNATTQLLIYNKDLFTEAGLIRKSRQKHGMNILNMQSKSISFPQETMVIRFMGMFSGTKRFSGAAGIGP